VVQRQGLFPRKKFLPFALNDSHGQQNCFALPLFMLQKGTIVLFGIKENPFFTLMHQGNFLASDKDKIEPSLTLNSLWFRGVAFCFIVIIVLAESTGVEKGPRLLQHACKVL
jgi:hypothetical protein